jgi:hypothetical protein
MRFGIVLVCAILLNACIHTSKKIMTDSLISVTLTCKDNPTCEFNGDKMPIVVSIKNNHSTEIGVPIAFMQKTGPIIKLIDTETERGTNLKVNLASPELLKNLTKIAPGQSAFITWHIAPFELMQFGHEKVDVTAEATISTKVWISSKDESIDVIASGSTKIIGKEKGK